MTIIIIILIIMIIIIIKSCQRTNKKSSPAQTNTGKRATRRRVTCLARTAPPTAQ